MNMKVFIISLIPILFYIIIRTKKALHMLQQNWYNDGNRYIKWIFKNFEKAFNITEISVLLIILGNYYLNNTISIISYSLSYLIVGALYFKEMKYEQTKKPLVITKRIRRLIATVLFLYLLPFVVYYFKFKNINYVLFYQITAFILIFINFLIVWLANIINKPVEKQVFYYYKRQAVRKLKQMSTMKVVGITGSYGKTSSKNILNDILNIKFDSFATPQNFNTTYGLINSVNNYLDKFSEIFIAEMGAFKLGEIKELSDLMKPKYGILTKVGVAHLESFGSRENIQKGKFELIESLPSDGIGILNRDDEYQVNYELENDCQIIWIGIENKDSDIYADNIKLSHTGMTFDVYFNGDSKPYKFETKLLGKANIYNILAGIALGREFGLTIEQLQLGVKAVNSIPHRLELKKYGNINIIDDAYNSNPVGSKMALEVLSMMPGKKIVVTPGMIDLGVEQYNLNKEFGTYIADVADEVILIGEEQTTPIKEGLIEKKYKEKHIHILNDVKEAFLLIQELQGKETYVLLENDLPDIFNE